MARLKPCPFKTETPASAAQMWGTVAELQHFRWRLCCYISKWDIFHYVYAVLLPWSFWGGELNIRSSP